MVSVQDGVMGGVRPLTDLAEHFPSYPIQTSQASSVTSALYWHMTKQEQCPETVPYREV